MEGELEQIQPLYNLDENQTALFLPLNMKIGGPVKVRYAKDKEAICLTKDQARHMYTRR